MVTTLVLKFHLKNIFGLQMYILVILAHMCVCLSVCVSIHFWGRYCLNVFLPPLPVVGCPKFFVDTESLGNSNEKKWSQIWKLLLIKGVRLPRKEKFVLGEFCLSEQDFFCYQFISLRLTVFLPPLHEVKCPNFLDFRNPWGKVMERSGLWFKNFRS